MSWRNPNIIPPPKIVIPTSLLEIKTPQLIGIVCGLIVFSVTISVVFYLFYMSGAVERLKKELNGQNNDTGASESSISKA